MKKLIALLLLAGCSVSATAQKDNSIESLLNRAVPDCFDISHNAIEIIPSMHERQLHDSLQKVIAYWEDKCGGMGEPLFTFKVLYAIEQGTFSERIYESVNAVKLTNAHRSNVAIVTTGSNPENAHYKKYYKHIKEMAVAMERKQGLTAIEQYFVSFYANPDSAFAENVLASETYGGSTLQRQYIDMEKKQREMRGLYIAAIAGAWVPTGDLSVVGAHPYIGYEIGGRGKRLQVGLTLYFSFINSPNTYFVMKDSILYPTRHFFGGYLGVNSSYDIIQTKKSMFCVLAGVGYDGFDVLSIGKGINKETESVGALNLNAGLGYRIRVGKTSYLGLEVKYNNVNYANPGGTDLSGDAFTIGLSYGGIFKANKDE